MCSSDLLMENKGIVLDRDRLLDMVWGVGFDGTDRVVDSQIKKLRKSLGSYGGAIRTVTYLSRCSDYIRRAFGSGNYRSPA